MFQMDIQVDQSTNENNKNTATKVTILFVINKNGKLTQTNRYTTLKTIYQKHQPTETKETSKQVKTKQIKKRTKEYLFNC